MNRYRNANSRNMCRNFSEINDNLLIVAIAFACAVITGMQHCAVISLSNCYRRRNRFALCFAILVQQECRSVQIEFAAAGVFVRIPAQTDDYFGQSWICFGKVDTLSFREINDIFSHSVYLF